MTMLLGPSKAVLSGTLGKDGEAGENGEGEAPADVAATAVEDAVPEADGNGAEPVAHAVAEPVAEDDAEPVAEDDAEPAADDDDAAPVADDDAKPAA
jgi:translation initiation factor IF-3